MMDEIKFLICRNLSYESGIRFRQHPFTELSFNLIVSNLHFLFKEMNRKLFDSYSNVQSTWSVTMHSSEDYHDFDSFSGRIKWEHFFPT